MTTAEARRGSAGSQDDGRNAESQFDREPSNNGLLSIRHAEHQPWHCEKNQFVDYASEVLNDGQMSSVKTSDEAEDAASQREISAGKMAR